MTLDRLLPLPEAARKFGLAEVKLRALIDKGTIRAGQLPTGEILVSEKDASAQKQLPKEELPEYKKHAYLKGIEIWMMEASRKYDIPSSTLTRWINAGYISRLSNDGYRTFLDEADVAYCAEIYHKRSGQGKWLFNRDGTPYKPKNEPLKEK
jgi:hypothetical protein